MKWRRFFISLLLLPVFGALAIEKPEEMSLQEWDNLTPGEQEGLGISDDAIEGEEGDITEEDLDAVLEEEEAESHTGKTPEELAVEAEEEKARIAALSEPKRIAAEQASAEAATAAALAAASVVEPSYEDILTFRPVISESEVPLPTEVPAELQAKLDALDAKANDLDDQFDAGDITRSDLRTLERAIQKERDAINREVLQYQISQRDMAREDLKWKKEQLQFITTYAADYKQYAEDGKTLSDRSLAMFGALQGQVNRLISDPAWQDKPGMAILIEADKRVLSALGQPERGKGKATTTGKPAPPAAPLPNQPNLAQIPAAGEHDADPFAYIDRIKDPLAKEQAIASMGPEKQAAYLAGAKM